MIHTYKSTKRKFNSSKCVGIPKTLPLHYFTLLYFAEDLIANLELVLQEKKDVTNRLKCFRKNCKIVETRISLRKHY